MKRFKTIIIEYGFRAFFSLLRCIFRLRYQFEFNGIERVKEAIQNAREGSLFLPNHTSLFDALILNAFLWPKFRMRAVASTYQFSLVRIFLKHSGGVRIPDLEHSVNQVKIRNVHRALGIVDQGLKVRERFLLFPAGRLKRSGNEVLKRSSAAHLLVQNNPGVNVILIRTSGLWGSRFSVALTGQTPNFFREILSGIKIVLKNLIFFCPRRKVTIELLANPPEFPRNANRQQFNRYLENWYNQYVGGDGEIVTCEPLALISYYFWKTELPIVTKTTGEQLSKGLEISDQERLKIIYELRRILENPTLEIHPQSNLAFDLGMDSLNLADLSTYLLRNYEIEMFQTECLNTVQDVFDLAGGGRVRLSVDRPISLCWQKKEEGRPDPVPLVGKTIPEAFLYTCKKMGGKAACGDDVTGVISYRKMKLSVLVLSEFFRAIPETNIAVMMPASVGGFITVLAIQLAGKVPVMLNWTLGSRYLEEMMKNSESQRLITSERFLDRLSHIEFGNLVDQMEFLEDIRNKISLRMKLRNLWMSLLPNWLLRRKLNLQHISPTSPCVILFTSGTEAQPKGVPLSHRNVLENIRDFVEVLAPHKNDSLLAILPPFHVLGFTCTGLASLLSGIKIAFYPDPTNSEAVAESIFRWQVSIFSAPSSFLKKIGDVATNLQLQTVRFFGTGGEKLSLEVVKRINDLGTGARILEAYGISECGGAVATQNPKLSPKGLGQILPSYEFCTIHPETLEPMAAGQEGEICLRGSSVFNGYLKSSRSPFIEIMGKQWYRTGDMGRIENDRTLHLSGRLRRFTKLSGEMISLGAVEETLTQKLIGEGRISAEAQSCVVCADERLPGKPRLILFVSFSIEREEANRILSQSGFSNLVKIYSVNKLSVIPILPTGKVDYRQLQSLATA